MNRMKYLTFSLHHSRTILAFLLLLYPNISHTSTVFALSSGNETDRLALLAFKDRITEDPLGILSTWNSSDHCDWTGISCSERYPGRVSVLDLQSRKLTGSITPRIGNLSFLTGINLKNNSFKGELPQELGLLLQLRYLNLSTNVFEGEIPRNLSRCTELEIINLNYNSLVGEIPYELSSLVSKKLKEFLVSNNGLSGEIPLWFGNASSLTVLSMRDNKLQGRIPVGLGKLNNLQLLQIGWNYLAGAVPLSVFNISSLLYLDIGDNQLHGYMPSDIGITLPNLLGLYIGRNWFTGSFPTSLVNASGLMFIDISVTNLTGTLPSNLGSLRELSQLSINDNMLESTEAEGLNFLTSLTNSRNLKWVDIEYNRFQGKLPASIGNFTTNFEQLIARGNQISGTIPKEIKNLTGLTRLVLSSNFITGEIPMGIGNLKRLQDLSLYENKISGPIPPSLGNLTLLNRLELHANNLTGNIPESLRDCRQLELLLLHGNKLTGVIPKEVAAISSISLAFNLANNLLTGPLPTEVGGMKNLYELDVSGNNLTGEIPGTISNCLMLEILSLQGNLFSGPIPSELSSLSSLHFLDLSLNNFSGKVPVFLQNLTFLQKVNLSFNNLEGEVPKEGVFENTSVFSVVGNSKLCGGLVSLGLPACNISGSKQKDLAIKVAVPIAIVFSTLLVCAFVYLCIIKQSDKGPSSSTMPDMEKYTKVSYKELLQATEKFSPFNLVGEGQYGSVYKGILGKNKVDVAVKVINLTEKGAAKSFISECNALRNIRHRNLIKIITTCSSIDSKGADFKALVFKFVPNGSLEQWLHIREGEQDHQRSFLSLNQRLNIAMDIASALEYLHHHCQIPIVHGDLKPSNILIDYDMTAQVGDFGLARFLSDIRSSSSQEEANSTGIRGTVGYVAPEYGMGSEASKKGDVYSFGILLLEMFTGLRPTDSLFHNGLNLHQFTKTALPKRAMEIVEPSLLLEFGEKDGQVIGNGNNKMGKSIIQDCLVEILKIGVLCSVESPAERMDMRDVVTEMSTIRKKYMS